MHWHTAEQWGGEDSGSEISPKGKRRCIFFFYFYASSAIQSLIDSVTDVEKFALCPHCSVSDHWICSNVSVWTVCTSLQSARLFIALSVVYCKPPSHSHSCTQTHTHRVRVWFQERTLGHPGSNTTLVFISWHTAWPLITKYIFYWPLKKHWSYFFAFVCPDLFDDSCFPPLPPSADYHRQCDAVPHLYCKLSNCCGHRWTTWEGPHGPRSHRHRMWAGWVPGLLRRRCTANH